MTSKWDHYKTNLLLNRWIGKIPTLLIAFCVIAFSGFIYLKLQNQTFAVASTALSPTVQLTVTYQNPVPARIVGGYVVAHIDSLRPDGYTVSFGPATAEIRRWVDGVSWVPATTASWDANSNRMYLVYSFPAEDGWESGQQFQIMVPPFFLEIARPDGSTERLQHSEIKLFGWIK